MHMYGGSYVNFVMLHLEELSDCNERTALLASAGNLN